MLLSLLLFITNKIIDKKANFKINPDAKYVIFGHSHSECAFNDSLITNFVNLSQSAESYFYTYQKVKKVITQNPQIEVVFIEFTNNQIDKGINRWIWLDKYMNSRYPVFLPFMDNKQHLLLLTKNFASFSNCLSISFRDNVIRIIKNDYDYTDKLGGYFYLVKDKTDSINTLENKIVPNKDINIEISSYNIEYLTKIIEFCNNNNKKVYLIRCPQHSKYSRLINEHKYNEIIKTNFSSTEYFDFCNFPIQNSEFGDLEHLNYKGAKVFSIWFEDLLQNDLLNIQNKQDFINKKIQEFDNNK